MAQDGIAIVYYKRFNLSTFKSGLKTYLFKLDVFGILALLYHYIYTSIVYDKINFLLLLL